MMPERGASFAAFVVWLVILSGCAAPAATPIVHVVVVTQLVPAPTLEPLPTCTTYPTHTPYPTYTPAPPVVVTATPATPAQTTAPTRKPAPAQTARPALSGEYTSIVNCLGGADLSRYSADYNPQAILDAYKRDSFAYADESACRSDITAKINALRQAFNCLAALGEPSSPDLKTARRSALDALDRFITIRDTLLGVYLCRAYNQVVDDKARLAQAQRSYQGTVINVKDAQAMLDKYKREHAQ